MIVPLNLELQVNPTVREEWLARQRAADDVTLGIDVELARPMRDAAWAEVLAHLVMFDPTWLFVQPWVTGWIVEPQ